MGIKHIDKKSYPYLILRWFVIFWHNRVFYKRVVINNLEDIPKDAHLIFTGNHQNALMDAMVFLCGTKRPLVFMARSDIFNNRFIAALLYFFRMLPIFRIRDGFSALKKNNEIFSKTIDVINNKIGLVIMVEGNHGAERRLRSLKKGFARIAFQTEEANNFDLDMQVVPVGIDYSNFDNFRTELLINFGKPIPFSEYYDAYRESPAIAINQVKDRLVNHMKPIMVHIESEKYYELYDELREIYKNEMAQKMGLPSTEQPHKLLADQELIKHLEQFEQGYPKKISAFQKLVIHYKDNITSNNLNYSVVRKKPDSFAKLIGESILFILASPIFIVGWLLNYLPFGISIFIGKKMEDPQFKSSVKFAVSMLLWPLFYALQILLVWLLSDDWKVLLGFIIGMPILGMLSRSYWVSLQLYLVAFRWALIKKNKITLYRSIRSDLQEILKTSSSIVS